MLDGDTILIAGIRSELKRIQDEQKKLDDELETIRAICSHPNATKVNRGSEGNILTGRDPSYWRECSCPDCGQIWTEDQ